MTSAQELAEQVAGETLATEFVATATAHADRIALRQRAGDGWEELTYGEYADRVARAAAGLRALGVAPGDRLVLMMRNIAEFHVVDTAAYFCGATPISIYNSSSPEQVAYLAGHSRASLAIVEDVGFRKLFDEVRADLPGLRHIVSVRDDSGDSTYADLLAHEPLDLAAAAGVVGPGDLATVIYTSGTTGPPKGVMITHANVTFTVASLMLAMGRPREWFAGKRLLSYLPMAHIAERMTSHYSGIVAGYEVTACPDLAQLGPMLRETRPNIFFGVPRVWEKLHAGVVAATAADPAKAQQLEGAIAMARPLVQKRAWDEASVEELATLAALDQAAFAGVRSMLGLDQVDHAIVSAAPMSRELLEWFRGLGVPLTELYGMSESSGPMTWEAHRVKPGTVGRELPGCEVRLLDDGEIVCRGGNVFAGYLDDPERTAEALDADGWLHSGDIGTLDADGYFAVVDRKKELIITAGGKNISPANLEASLKLVPLVGQACVIGDNRPYVSALLVLDPEKARAWAAQHGKADATLAALAADPEVHEVVGAGVTEAMADFNNAERVKRWTLLADEWLPDSIELTPTSKLKRRNIHTAYAAEIEALYS